MLDEPTSTSNKSRALAGIHTASFRSLANMSAAAATLPTFGTVYIVRISMKSNTKMAKKDDEEELDHDLWRHL